jgi:hypothetical protein
VTLARRLQRGAVEMSLAVKLPHVAPRTLHPSDDELRVGDRVVVVPVAWIPASAGMAGRDGRLLMLDRVRSIAGVRFEGGGMHAMPANCLRRVSAEAY